MPVNTETLNKNIYDELNARGMDPVPLDSKGDPSDELEKADVFRFQYDSEDPKKVSWVTIEGPDLVFYVDDDFVKSANFEPFARFMKAWARRKTLGFEITNKDHLSGDMKKRTVMKKKEDMMEGYYPMGKKASYNDSVPQVKIILQHTRQIEEGEQRFRNVAKIFVENTNGERFLLPTNRPGLARVYARHIAEGGTPYDDKGRHITTLVEEYQKMAGFVRATRNGQFNESAMTLVNEGLRHYNDLRMTLQGMASHRGYNKYFESYTPVLNEETDDEISLNELFVQETLDPRIESVLPILNRLSKNITEMNEVKELEEWAESITEVEDETTKTLAEPADEMLEEVDTGEHDARKTTPSSKEKQEKVFAKHRERMKNLDEAPGAETLAHDDKTEKSNLKAFDLDEGDMEEGIKDITKKIGKKFRQSAIGRAREYGYSIEEGFSPSEEVADMIIQSMGGAGELTSDDIYRAIDEYQYHIMDNPERLDADEVAQIIFDKLHSKGIMVPDISEDLDANQKRVGQLGPTEKVGPKGAVGRLVGASESVELGRLKSLSGIK